MIWRILSRIVMMSTGALVLSACVVPDGYGGDPYYDRQSDEWYVVAALDGSACYPVAYDPFYDASYYALWGYGWSPVDCYGYSQGRSRGRYAGSPYGSSIYYGNHYGLNSPFWYGYSPGYYSGYYSGYNSGLYSSFDHGYYHDPYWGYYPWGHTHHSKKKKKRKPRLMSADGKRQRISPEVDYDEAVRHRIGAAPNWPTPVVPTARVRPGRGWASPAVVDAPKRIDGRVDGSGRLQTRDAPVRVDAPTRVRQSDAPVVNGPSRKWPGGSEPTRVKPRQTVQPSPQPSRQSSPQQRTYQPRPNVLPPRPVITQPSAPRTAPTSSPPPPSRPTALTPKAPKVSGSKGKSSPRRKPSSDNKSRRDRG